MLGFPPTAPSFNTSPPIISVLLLLMHFLFSLFLVILWGMSIFRVITHSSCGECICDVSAHPLAAAARHKLPWKHLATEASGSLSWLGVIKPVKWNRWESVAPTWSFCSRYLRNQDFPNSCETFRTNNSQSCISLLQVRWFVSVCSQFYSCFNQYFYLNLSAHM